jgi:hypothetical protein
MLYALNSLRAEWVVRGITWTPCEGCNVVVGIIGGSTDWLDVIGDCEVVVHLAARAYVMQEAATNSHIVC